MARRRARTSASINVSASVTRVRIENLNAGSRYYLVVRAVNNGGQVSGPSSEVNGLASDVLPAAPAGSAQTYYAEGAVGVLRLPRGGAEHGGERDLAERVLPA